MLIWNTQFAYSTSERVARIEASRFTANNGLQIWKEIAAVKEQMASMPREVPPSWFLEKVSQIDSRLLAIERKLP